MGPGRPELSVTVLGCDVPLMQAPLGRGAAARARHRGVAGGWPRDARRVVDRAGDAARADPLDRARDGPPVLREPRARLRAGRAPRGRGRGARSVGVVLLRHAPRADRASARRRHARPGASRLRGRGPRGGRRRCRRADRAGRRGRRSCAERRRAAAAAGGGPPRRVAAAAGRRRHRRSGLGARCARRRRDGRGHGHAIRGQRRVRRASAITRRACSRPRGATRC